MSVIVPTFNRASVIRRSLDSIGAQTYSNIEIVVVDDGSTDGTASLVDDFGQETDKTVIYRRQANAGCAAARNAGLDLASGDFVCFLDSDDAWLPTAAEALVGALRSSGAAFVYSPSVEVYEDGRTRVNDPVAADRPEALAYEHFIHTNVRNGAFMFRREVIDEIGKLDEELRHNEDSDFVQRMAVRFPAAYCSEPTVRVFHHPGNKSRNRAGIYEALIQSSRRVLTENPEFASELGERAEKRLRDLQRRYIEALILAGDFEEARSKHASARSGGELALRLALGVRSARVLEIRDRLARSRRRTRSRLGRIVRFVGASRPAC